MRLTIKWEFIANDHEKLVFTSEPIEIEKILPVIEQIEKTGRAQNIQLEDETGFLWTKKEIKKYVMASKGEADQFELYFDGGYVKGSRNGGIGAVLYFQQGDKKIRYRWNQELTDVESNNEAEYRALYFALSRLNELHSQGIAIKGKRLLIKGDSQGVLKQLAGEWPVYDPVFSKWLDRIEGLLKILKVTPEFHVIPRKDNQEADQLATQAINGIRVESRNVVF